MPKLLKTPFEEWTATDAEKVIKKVEEYDVNKAFIVEGDHWQTGSGWIGPRPLPSDAGAQAVLAEIQNGFTSRNVMKEVVERHTLGIAGKEIMWTFIPRRPITDELPITDQEKSVITEIETALTEWWDKRKMQEWIQQWVRIMLWAERSVFRLFVPAGLLVENAEGETMFEAEDLLDGLMHVFPDIPLPEFSVVHTDNTTKEEVGVFKFESEGKKSTEIVFRAAVESEGYEEGEGIVILKIMADNEQRFTIPLNGNLTMYQGSRPLLITKQVQQCQRALNLALTIIPRNIVTGGFLERVILNGQLPGTWELDEKGNRKRFIPDLTNFRVGPGVTNWISGVDYEDQEGQLKLATPSVAWHDPISPEFAIKAKEAHYTDMLEEVDQAHVLMNADANASGRSREQARADFINTLLGSKLQCEGVVRWVLETALALAEFGSGAAGKYTKTYRAVATCQLDAGPISVEERKQNIEEADKGYIAKTTAMARNGVGDPDAEQTTIDGQTDASLSTLKVQAEITQILSAAGASLATAGKLVKLPPEALKELEADEAIEEDEEEPPVPPSGQRPPVEEEEVEEE